MIHPTIHLNGTSKSDLLAQFRTAYLSLADAKRDLIQAAPHPRDYYPQGPDAFLVVQDEFRARLEKIESVIEDLDKLSLRIAFPEEKS